MEVRRRGVSASLLVLLAQIATTATHSIVERGEPDAPAAAVGAGNEDGQSLLLQMPGALPNEDDNYLCKAFEISQLSGTNESVYVTAFEAVNAVASKAHHMLLYGCDSPNYKDKIFDCRHHGMCNGGQKIMFAWAKNAQPKDLPDMVSYKLDPKEMKYLVLQVHYAHPLQEKDYTGLRLKYQMESTRYTAGIYLLLRSYLAIPPNTPVVHGDMNCVFNGEKPIHPFAFRTHAHKLGVVISGYKYSVLTKEFEEIAKGNPQWPQAFYPIEKNVTIAKNDVLAARCTYNSTGSNSYTNIGATAGDEMCNLYLMFYTEADEDGHKSYMPTTCINDRFGDVSEHMPEDSDKPLPHNPLLEEMAMHKINKGELDQMSEFTQTRKGSKNNEEKEENSGRRKGDLDNPKDIDDDDQGDDDAATEKTVELRMPGSSPERDDDYYCTAFNISKITGGKRVYVTGFDARARAVKAHHIILQKCVTPVKEEGEIWNCMHHAVCRGPTKIMFAWAKDAPGTQLPPGVGFRLDPEDDGYLVMQVHYAHALPEKDHSGLAITYTEQKPENFAGVFLMFRSFLRIPPGLESVHGDVNCRANMDITLFAYRTHAHSLGSVITGYKVGDEFQEIARGDPQKPQTFYPMSHFVHVSADDYLAARCTYDSRSLTKVTRIGSTAGDEMCNLYLMYYSPDEENDMRICGDEEVKKLSEMYPADSDVPIAKLGQESADDDFSNGHLDNNGISVEKKTDKKEQDVRQGKNLDTEVHLYPVPEWPVKATLARLGQVSGVSIDAYGNPVVFHRGDRQWDMNTFRGNRYSGPKHPIPVETILTLNSTGDVVNAWGKDMFYMPHMITVDRQNNVWVTDVALHQVFKFAAYGGNGAQQGQPLFVLGKPFENGDDDTHYCKPTAVAVEDDGKHFYVSDGYCNSRVIKYSLEVEKGTGHHKVTKVWQIGESKGGFSRSASPFAFNVPHGLALAEDKGLICVADRENSRVQCFKTSDGTFHKTINPPEMGRTYSVAYSKFDGGSLYSVNGPEPFGAVTGRSTQGLVIDIDTGKVKAVFNGAGEGFQNPHDIAVSSDGAVLYEAELRPFRVWKLTNGEGGGERDEMKKQDQRAKIPPTLSPVEAVPGGPTSSYNPELGANPADPNAAVVSTNGNQISIRPLTNIVPTSTLGVVAAVGSVLLTCCLSLCLACRRCRKRGKGTMLQNGPNSKRKSSKKGDKNNGKLDLGDFLGRSKEGFQRVRTEEGDDDDELSTDSEDELGQFSVPSLRA